MKKFLLTFYALIFISGFSIAQKAKREFSVGGKNSEIARSIASAKDGGFAFTGYTYSYGDTVNGDVYVVKINNAGTVQWTRSIGGKYFDYGEGIVGTLDGGFAITGNTYSYGDTAQGDIYVIKLDSLGNVKWTETIGSNNSDEGVSIIQTKDKGYAIAGFTGSYGDAVHGNGYIVKLDSLGGIQWGRSIGGKYSEYFNSIIQSSDGGYVATGYTFSYADTNEAAIYVVKLDSAGNLKWTRVAGGEKGEVGLGIIQALDGGYAITGTTNSFGAGNADGFLLKLDTAGSIKWMKTYGGPANDCSLALVQTKDSGFILAGYTYSYGDVNNGDAYVIKLNSSAGIMQTQTMGGTHAEYMYSIARNKNNEFALAGTTYSYKDTSNGDAYIIQLDTAGNACLATGSGGVEGNVTGEDLGTVGVVTNGGAITSTNEGKTSSGGVYTNICDILDAVVLVTPEPEQVTVFPNPSSGTFAFQFLDVSRQSSVEIYNMFGEKVLSQYPILTSQYPLDLSNQPSGVYLYRITNTDGSLVSTGKLIKQ